MEEIPIEDVDFEDFAIVLSLVHSAPIKYTKEQVEPLLEIADRFQLPAARRHLELFIMTTDITATTKISIAEKYQLNDLMDHTLSTDTTVKCFCKDNIERRGPNMELFDKLSKGTKVKIFHRILEMDSQISVSPKAQDSSIYEKVFEKTDKTDATLVVDGKKLHVNKAVLSYHSDYFNTLFNSDFKEKSMEEIEIKDIVFEDFATVLSFVQLKAIKPTEKNVENVLELADRFMIQCVKFYLEPLIIYFKINLYDDIRIGDKYGMNGLVKNGIKYMSKDYYKNLTSEPFYKELSDDTKVELLYRYMKIRIES